VKRTFAALLLILATFPLAYASSKHAQSNPYLEGTVLQVEKHQSMQSTAGSNPSDAPLADPETYDYDVAVRVNCGTYVGRVESWYDYVPAGLSANQKIQLRLAHGTMYVDVPNQKEVPMRIVSRHEDRGSCNSLKN
jgi:hypothetical protein